MTRIQGKVSVIIPARNEAYLQQTVDDLLAKAAGDIEIIVVLDGWWPNPALKEDERVITLHRTEPKGMRPAINDAANMASGQYLLKTDAHCIFGEGYDEILKADCDYDWLVVPTRHSIDIPTWTIRKRDYNYSMLTYPFLESMYGAGFHAVTFNTEQNREINRQRAAFDIDDILSAQGSLWFQHTEYFLSFPPLDHERLYFYQEAQCVMLRILAAGGRCVVTKKTAYGHMHKGKDHKGADGRPGRGFYLDVRKKRAAEALMTDWCIKGWPWPNAIRSFESMIEQHWWLISQMKDPRYAWPNDWRDWEKHRAAFENRTPEQIPAHT